CGAAARISRNGARALTAIIVSQISSVVASSVPLAMTPAAFTRTSMPPNASAAVRTTRSGASSAVTSARQMTGRPPASRTAVAASPSAPSSRPTTTTDAPSRPNASAAARPIPLVAPVTMTLLPAKDIRGVYPRSHNRASSKNVQVARIQGETAENHRQGFCLGRWLPPMRPAFAALYSPREIARAAGVCVEEVLAALGNARRHQYVPHDEAVRLGRLLATHARNAATIAPAPLFASLSGRTASQRPLVPLVLSSSLHIAFVVVLVVVAGFNIVPRA